MEITVYEPSVPESLELTMEDVFGNYEEGTKGMMVANSDETCPIFKDTVPYKSVTVVCDKEQEAEVVYWLGYVHGGDCISMTKDLPNNKMAIRSDYKCW